MPNQPTTGVIVKTPTAVASVLAAAFTLIAANAGAATESATAAAKAADAYLLKIESSFVISDSCAIGNGQQNSQITIMIDAASATTDVKALTKAAAQIKVCSPYVSPINETLPVPLPLGLLKQGDKVPLNKPATYALAADQYKGVFKDGNPPTILVATKIATDTFELKYIQQSTGAVRIGPIRAYLVPAAKMASIPGYVSANLPLDHVEIEVPENSVTLKADIVSVKAVAAKTTASH